MSRRAYFNLSIPAPKRLALMREDFVAHPKKYPHCPESAKPKSWRDMRETTFRGFSGYFGLSLRGFNSGPITGELIPVITSFDARDMPVRSVVFADDVECTPITHRGWFADSNGYGDTGVVRGIIGRLPHGRFLSGYHWSDSDEYVLFVGPGRIFDNEVKAARKSDHEAERFAETCREDDARFRAMIDAESLVDSKESDLCDAWDEYRAARCAYLINPSRHASTAAKAREWVRELISDLRTFRRELTDARKAYENG